MAGLEKRSNHSDKIHISSTTESPTYNHCFCVGHNDAQSLLLHDQTLYVSSWKDNLSVKLYTLQGEMKVEISLTVGVKSPYLCTVDSEDNVMFTDRYRDCLRVLNTRHSSPQRQTGTASEVKYLLHNLM